MGNKESHSGNSSANSSQQINYSSAAGPATALVSTGSNDPNSSRMAGMAQAIQAPTPPPISPPTRTPGMIEAPGAYKMPGQPRQQRFYVTIPRGVRPGQHFAVLVNGQQMMVRCPEANKPGDRLIVTAPRQETQQFVVTVPANVRPGQQFRVMIQNQEVMVTCPRGVRSGQRVTFQLPRQEPPPRAAPNHQMFEVAVPEGVRPGQPFALIANGQRVMVTCPPNVRAGQKIRFQLPIQLTEQQLGTIKVSYDKDGWMRCLGQDLKFHWCYNVTSNGEDSSKAHRIPYDVEGTAFVRSLTPNPNHPGNVDISLVVASEYAIDTSVKNTSVNYDELNRTAQLPFQAKCDWLKAQFNALRTPWEEGHIKIRVRRFSMLQDCIDAWESIDPDDMKKIFRFEFINEPALDAGGVAREFYEMICEQIFNPDCGLFLSSTVNQMCMQINPNSGIANEFHLRYFHMVGRLLGKSLMDNQITPVHLVQPLYKHLMGWPISLRDLEQIDDQIYRNLIGMLDMEDVSILGMDFSITEDQLGVTATINLIENGCDVDVTNENCAQYLEAQLKYRLFERIKLQLGEMVKGFYDVVPEPLLSVFDFQEIELLLHGLPNIDMDDWIINTEYTGEFSNQPNHKVATWFWEVVRSFEQEQKAKLLQFVTGTSGVPVQGFGYLQGNDGNIRKFTLHGDKNVKVFPRAHTCFNRIDMPIYKNKAELQKYLTMAISIESTGFGIE